MTRQRTCIGCRRVDDPVRMLRFVAADGQVEIDVRHRLPGRGAWLHPSPSCADQADRRRAWGRALRVSGELDVSAVRSAIPSRV